jgi:hypothetical protein
MNMKDNRPVSYVAICYDSLHVNCLSTFLNVTLLCIYVSSEQRFFLASDRRPFNISKPTPINYTWSLHLNCSLALLLPPSQSSFVQLLFLKYVPTKEKSFFPYYWKFSTSSNNFLSKNKSLTLLMTTHNQSRQLHLFTVLQSTSWTI